MLIDDKEGELGECLREGQEVNPVLGVHLQEVHLRFVEPSLLDEDLRIDLAFADVVEQGALAEDFHLLGLDTDLLAEHHREDRDIHRVVIDVLVLLGEPHQMEG